MLRNVKEKEKTMESVCCAITCNNGRARNSNDEWLFTAVIPGDVWILA